MAAAGHGVLESGFPHHTVAATAFTRIFAIGPDRELLQQHRKVPSQHFRVSDQGVGRVGMHAIAAVEIGPRSRHRLGIYSGGGLSRGASRNGQEIQ